MQEVLAPSPEITHKLDNLSPHQLFVFQRIVDNFRVFFHQGGDGLTKEQLESDTFVTTMELLALAENMPTQALVMWQCARFGGDACVCCVLTLTLMLLD